MKRAKAVERFPSFKEYRELTFEKCVQKITREKHGHTKRAMNWMKRFLKAHDVTEGSWFHKKEVPDYVYAAACCRAFAEWKQAEISRSASGRGKHGLEVRRKKNRERLQKDRAAVSVVAHEALTTGKTTAENLKKAGII